MSETIKFNVDPALEQKLLEVWTDENSLKHLFDLPVHLGRGVFETQLNGFTDVVVGSKPLLNELEYRRLRAEALGLFNGRLERARLPWRRRSYREAISYLVHERHTLLTLLALLREGRRLDSQETK